MRTKVPRFQSLRRRAAASACSEATSTAQRVRNSSAAITIVTMVSFPNTSRMVARGVSNRRDFLRFVFDLISKPGSQLDAAPHASRPIPSPRVSNHVASQGNTPEPWEHRQKVIATSAATRGSTARTLLIRQTDSLSALHYHAQQSPANFLLRFFSGNLGPVHCRQTDDKQTC